MLTSYCYIRYTCIRLQEISKVGINLSKCTHPQYADKLLRDYYTTALGRRSRQPVGENLETLFILCQIEVQKLVCSQGVTITRRISIGDHRVEITCR